MRGEKFTFVNIGSEPPLDKNINCIYIDDKKKTMRKSLKGVDMYIQMWYYIPCSQETDDYRGEKPR